MLFRVLAWLFLSLIAVVLLLLMAVRVQPALLIWAVERASGATITTAQQTVQLWPFSLHLTNFTIDAPQARVEGDELEFQVDWWAWSEDAPFWSVTGRQIGVHLPEATAQETEPQSIENDSDSGGLPAIPSVALAFQRIALQDLTVKNQTWSITLNNGPQIEHDVRFSTPDLQAMVQGHVGVVLNSGITLSDPDIETVVNDTGPLYISGDSVTFDGQQLELSALTLRFKENSVLVSADIALEPLTVKGTVDAQQLTLSSAAEEVAQTDQDKSPQLEPVQEVSQEMPDSTADPEPVQTLFNDEPLPLEFLTAADLDVAISIGELLVDQMTIKQLQANIALHQGELSVPLSGRVGDGMFEQHLSIGRVPRGLGDEAGSELNADALEEMRDAAAVTLSFRADGVPFDELVVSELVEGGTVTARGRLSSQGGSSRSLAQGLQGDLTAMLEQARVANAYVDVVGSDLITQLTSKLNPFQAQDPTTGLECVLFNVPVSEGVMALDEGVYVQTRKMNIAGSGRIDLGAETLNVTLTPSARQGLGVNLASLVKFIKVGGPLTAPKPQLDSVGVLQSGLAIGAAVSTGGASLVAEGLAKRALNAGSPCAQWHKAQAD